MLKLRLEEKNKKLFLLYIFDRREKYIFERFSRLLEGMVRTTCRQNWGQVAICIENYSYFAWNEWNTYAGYIKRLACTLAWCIRTISKHRLLQGC